MERECSRRTFLKLGATVAAGMALPGVLAGKATGQDKSASPAGGLKESTWPKDAGKVNASRLPRWRGFNLLEKFVAPGDGPFRAQDFEWIKEWGFNLCVCPCRTAVGRRPKIGLNSARTRSRKLIRPWNSAGSMVCTSI